ncbi:hypothetical protein K466DRAFT_506552, partial [Polyporus arcularius HHB13444]
VKNRKERPRFSHIEENVYAGLKDTQTLTELAVMTLYDQAITHPYLRLARILQNGLKLGPMHDRLKAHISKLIADPDLLLGPTASPQTGALDGHEWQRPEAVRAVLTMQSNLPELRRMLVAFLKGSLITWGNFTVEFAKDGAIDKASEAELDEAWIFATNDHNEAALGSMRLWSRENPSGTQEYRNAQKKHDMNDTAAFMETYYTEDDHAHAIAQGRLRDQSGHESKRRKAHVQHAVSTAKQREKDQEARRERVEEANRKVDATVLVLKKKLISTFKKDQIEEQLEVYRKRFEPYDVPKKSKVPNKPEKLKALLKAVAQYRLEHHELEPDSEAEDDWTSLL